MNNVFNDLTQRLNDISSVLNSFLYYHQEAQRHIAAGGKVSDLPPPPPMDTSDYVECPHCSRYSCVRFE